MPLDVVGKPAGGGVAPFRVGVQRLREQAVEVAAQRRNEGAGGSGNTPACRAGIARAQGGQRVRGIAWSFAQQQFDFLPRSKKLTAHPAAKLEVVFKVAYGAQGTAGEIVRQTMSLTDMLLNNLSGLPSGQIEVFYNTGLKYKGSDFKVRVPELEKEGVLKQLVDDLDIGKTYPDLLR